jgi:hypothetical protein
MLWAETNRQLFVVVSPPRRKFWWVLVGFFGGVNAFSGWGASHCGSFPLGGPHFGNSPLGGGHYPTINCERKPHSFWGAGGRTNWIPVFGG